MSRKKKGLFWTGWALCGGAQPADAVSVVSVEFRINGVLECYAGWRNMNPFCGAIAGWGFPRRSVIWHPIINAFPSARSCRGQDFAAVANGSLDEPGPFRNVRTHSCVPFRDATLRGAFVKPLVSSKEFKRAPHNSQQNTAAARRRREKAAHE